ASASRRWEVYRRYGDEVNRLNREGGVLRGMFAFREGVRKPVPIEEVESVESICRRFNTGGMSYGSLSPEAHQTLAVAMNTIGRRWDAGGGGDEQDRLHDPWRGSGVKQVARRGFSVNREFLVSAGDIQSKAAQGAKPGASG